jgi:competence protein ComEA
MTSPGRLLVPAKRRVRLGLGAALVLVILGLGIAVLVGVLGPHGATQSLAPGGVPQQASATGVAKDKPGSGSAAAIFVHVIGAVERPGLFTLRDGDRVIDAIAAAGGFIDTADQGQVNLARFVTDGEQLVVPVVGATPPVAGAAGAGISGGKVNLNTADLATLETLPRVGPAMAQKIIDWRTSNGRFSSVEDLLSITGVGQKTFEQLKDLVTV